MADFVIRDVCKICFNASSQKANPTLTSEEKAINEIGRKVCPNCRQTWTGQKVAKDPELNRWVLIRPRPLKMNPHIDYQLCTSVSKRQTCPKGLGLCTFAHSRAELNSWNRDRYKDSRPVPTGVLPNQIILCKHVLMDGVCPYGQRCVYAHSEEEKDRWVDDLVGSRNAGYINTTSEYYCPLCNIHCTGQRQYEEHLSGQRHRQIVATQTPPTFQQAFYAPPPVYHTHPVMPPRLNPPPIIPCNRPMPDRIPANGFRLCTRVDTSRGCFFGMRCTFAHSEMELESWNRQVMQYRGQRIAAGSVQSYIQPSGSHGDLDEFESESHAIAHDQVDFAQRVRTTVMFDYQDKEKEPGKGLCGFEKTVQSVTVTEVSGREEVLTLSDSTGSVSWVFEVSATAPRALQSVVLFDVLAPEYSIDAIELVMYGGHTKPITPHAKTTRGAGLSIAQRITPPDKVNVKISFKPRSGVLGQMVIFDFGNFYMIRYLCVHVINEQDRRLLSSNTQRQNKNNRPDKIDYFWEQTYAMSTVDMDTDGTVDERLPEHQLPKVIEDLIDKGKYDNMQRKVIKKNYVRRMHNLLYLEEFQEIKDLSRYDIYDVEVTPKDHYIVPGEIINDPRYSFLTLDMYEMLFEGGRSIRAGDHVMMLLRPSTTGLSELHKCIVHSVMKDTVVLKMSKRTAEVCSLSGNSASVRFQPSRVAMRAMHEALDKVDSNVLFPDMAAVEATAVSPALRSRLNEIVDHSNLNGDQKNAMHSILDPLYKKIPTLVLGPFGCGKTRTLCECATLLSLHHPSARILICTHSNSAADIYVKAIHAEYTRKHNKMAPMLRLYYSDRNPRAVESEVLQFCKMRNDRFYHVDASELDPYSVVVTTTITARMLWLNGVERGYFTHILIDEAAQVLEAELLIALCLADQDTKIALAGDTMQMEPPVHSHYAKKYGLDISLLERLYSEELYNTDLGMKCKTKLLENHRSHYDILHLPSKLFYDNKLLCKAVFPPDGPKQIPNLQFVGVDGHESQDEQSPSYYNDEEVVKVAEEVTRFCNAGLAPEQVCVLSYYGMQVFRIRSYLRKMKLSKVEVHRIEGIQGREYRALIISTVRTCVSTYTEDEDGFLNNVKFFNTAITRAKEWLVLVGEPITLCTVGYNTACWMELIEDCIHKKTFRYQCPDMFMKFLETRVISRQIMQKNHGEFLKKSTAHPQANKVIAPPTSSEPIDPPRPVIKQTPPTSQPSLSVAQQQQQMVKATILKSMQDPDDAMAMTIYGAVLKLNPAQLKVFMTQPESAANYVKELENAMKRGGLTSVLMNNARLQQPPSNPDTAHHLPLQQQKPSGSNVSNMMGDLPSFLQAQVESLTQHLKFCELQKYTNQESLRNLKEQKHLLLQQMSLVNQQIIKYREFIRLNTMPSLVQSMSQLSTTNHTPLPTGMTSTVPQQQMMFGSASQTVGGAVPPTPNHQAFYRPDSYSSYHNSVLQQGGSNASQQHSFSHYGINPTPAGYANNNIVAGMMSQHATKIQQHPSAFNSMQSNTQQPSASLRTTFHDPFLHSQQSFRQTTQLISPLTDLAASQTTWNGDADSD